jgi:hypothetical protein
MLQTNLETLLFVASYDVVSYYRFLNTDPGVVAVDCGTDFYGLRICLLQENAPLFKTCFLQLPDFYAADTM